MQVGCLLLIKTLLIRFSRYLLGFIHCDRGFVFLYCHTEAHWLNRNYKQVQNRGTFATAIIQQRTQDLTKYNRGHEIWLNTKQRTQDSTEDTGLDRFMTYRTLRCLRPLKSILLMTVRLFLFRSLEPSENSGQRTGHETLVSPEKIMTITMCPVWKCISSAKRHNWDK